MSVEGENKTVLVATLYMTRLLDAVNTATCGLQEEMVSGNSRTRIGRINRIGCWISSHTRRSLILCYALHTLSAAIYGQCKKHLCALVLMIRKKVLINEAGKRMSRSYRFKCCPMNVG